MNTTTSKSVPISSAPCLDSVEFVTNSSFMLYKLTYVLVEQFGLVPNVKTKNSVHIHECILQLQWINMNRTGTGWTDRQTTALTGRGCATVVKSKLPNRTFLQPPTYSLSGKVRHDRHWLWFLQLYRSCPIRWIGFDPNIRYDRIEER